MSEHRLGEVLIERPRGGFRISSRRLRGAKRLLDTLTQEVIESESEGFAPYVIKVRNPTKYLSDNLGPLRRFLRSKVDKNWDDTYSELCDRLDSSTMLGQHLLEHLWHYVERHVELIDGLPYRMGRALYSGYHAQYYIHPKSHILLVAPSRSAKPIPARSQDLIVLDQTHHYRLVHGIWYELTFSTFAGAQSPWDQLLRQNLTPVLAYSHYGKLAYVSDKRQCNKRQLRDIRCRLARIK
jgi:hypothetical protein